MRAKQWALLWARVKYWSWQATTKVIIGTIYLAIIAEGFRYLVPVVGRKLHKLPLLGWMENYEGTYQLDLAVFLSLFMLIAVWNLWDQILTLWLDAKLGFDDRLWNQSNHVLFVVALGVVILASDAALFFVAVSQISWAGAEFSLTALLATTAYISVLLFVTYIGISLREPIHNLKMELTHVNRDDKSAFSGNGARSVRDDTQRVRKAS